MTSTERVRFVNPSDVPRHAVAEFDFAAAAAADHADPWGELDVDVEVTDPDGRVLSVPAFWAGGRSWRFRYSSGREGVHRFRSVVRRGDDPGLDGFAGEFTVRGYGGFNPLLVHGGPRVADDGRHLAHVDGTPFFWLGDTWWAGMTARFRWPDVFQRLADDRASKGFTVIQIVAGLVPEFVPFSPAMASEGGQPWHNLGAGSINPAYFAVPDVKIDYLVACGLAPCIVGGWGFWANILGRERIMRHWRYLVARYGAYPVVWCMAGEVDGVGIWEWLSRQREVENPAIVWPGGDHASVLARIDPIGLEVREDFVTEMNSLPPQVRDTQVGIWEDASNYVRTIDPFGRIRTVHPVTLGSDAFMSRDSLDLDMQQSGHGGTNSVPTAMPILRKALEYGDKPVLVGEASYEGIFDASWQDVQRFQFWANMLSGTAGHTYGTMAISTFNSRHDPHMPLSRVSAHCWEDAIDWLGAVHVGIGRRILERIAWWDLRAAPDAIEAHAGPDDWFRSYAAVTGDGTVVVYVPGAGVPSELTWGNKVTLLGLSSPRYVATWVDPRTGADAESITFSPKEGRFELPKRAIWTTPTGEDWVLLVRPAGA